ncbi:MAG: hypothetical protein AAF502_20875 [Bacteroidota bacterium]
MRFIYILIAGISCFFLPPSSTVAQVNCPGTAPTAPLLDCASVSLSLCPGESAFLPALTTTPELPTVEYVVTRVGSPASDGMGDEILGSTSSAIIDPTAFGLVSGELFDVTPVAYNLSSVQTLIDNIYNNNAGIFSCCFVVGLISADFCPNLMAGGISTGSDIQNISDVVTVISNLSGMGGSTTSIAGLLSSIEALNMQATGVLPASCGGSLLPICYAAGQGSGICNYTILSGIDPACLLPLELSSFSAEALPLKNTLRWTTETELNSAYFSIERSFDGSTFIEIGRMEAAGNSSVPLSYTFDDENPLTELNYYRLAQIGFDESVSYSAIILVERNDPNGFEVVSVGPIPNRGLLTVGIASSIEEPVIFKFIDVTGKEYGAIAETAAEGLNNFGLDTRHLNDGMYILTIIRPNSGIQMHVKFIKHLN